MLSSSERAIALGVVRKGIENVQKTSSCHCVCASTHWMQANLCLSRSKMGILNLESMKMSKNDKQGNKTAPNTGTIAGPGSFSLEERWLKKDVTLNSALLCPVLGTPVQERHLLMQVRKGPQRWWSDRSICHMKRHTELALYRLEKRRLRASYQCV